MRERWIEVANCPLCQNADQTPFETVVDGDFTLQYRFCTQCGLVFQSPRMAEPALERFYQQGYRGLMQGTEEPTEKDLRIQAGRARHLLATTQRHVNRVSRHLDIGASSGALLRAIRTAYACESVGIEPGEVYRRRAQATGLTMYPDLARMAEAGETRFDLISLAHVLEHLPDPVAYLSDLRENWMTDGAVLLLEVPNLYGHQSTEVAHVVLFSAGTLEATLRQSGFQPVALRSHGHPRSPILKLYLTALAKASIKPSRMQLPRRSYARVRIRRRAGMIWKATLTRVLPSWVWRPLPEPEQDPWQAGPTGKNR